MCGYIIKDEHINMNNKNSNIDNKNSNMDNKNSNTDNKNSNTSNKNSNIDNKNSNNTNISIINKLNFDKLQCYYCGKHYLNSSSKSHHLKKCKENI